MSTDAGMNRGTNRPMSTARTNSIPLERSTPRSSLESLRDRLHRRALSPSPSPTRIGTRIINLQSINHSEHSSVASLVCVMVVVSHTYIVSPSPMFDFFMDVSVVLCCSVDIHLES